MPVDAERFVVRRYRAGDEEQILDLFRRSFHQPRTLEEWQWKFQRNPSGNERISVTFEGTRLVAHYAGYPVAFRQGNADRVANQIGDTMTDPSIRHIGRGPSSILGRTALHFYEHFCEGRVSFNYGFNVANIQKFSLRFLRSDRVEPVTYRVRDVLQNPFPPLSRIERWARGVTLRIANGTGAEWDAFFDRVAPRYPFLVRRDARYVEWRYLDSPSFDGTVVEMRKWGTLAGWLVFRLRERRLILGDLLIDPDHGDVLDLALRHLTHIVPVERVELWCPPRPLWLDSLLKDLRFVGAAEPQDLSLMCVPFADPDAVARMREGLYYTMGDSDLF